MTLEKLFNSDDKKFNFIQKSLRGPLDIFKHGGHATAKFMDKSFSVYFNNKRIIIDNDNGEELTYKNNLLDTKPVPNVDFFLMLQSKKDLIRVDKYPGKREFYNDDNLRAVYSEYIDLAVRRFITILYANG
jgi:hypothetical protein